MHDIDFGARVDCVGQNRDVESRLVYGDDSFIVDPLITVFIPTHRRADFLEQALDSVLKQWHCCFMWDVIVLDNEEMDGRQNATERLIRKVNNKRILYYRNSRHLRPGDNFNRGIQLARGKWVVMLHDDDLLIYSALQQISTVIECSAKKGIDLGAIAANYVQFKYSCKNDYQGVVRANATMSSAPFSFKYLKIPYFHPLIAPDIGGSIPSVGACFNRRIFLEAGGFNDDLGVCADQVLFYNIMQRHTVLQPTVPLGFWRWSENNNSSSIANSRRVFKNQLDFKMYVFRKNPVNRLWGWIFGGCLRCRLFELLREQAMIGLGKGLDEKQFDYPELPMPGRLVYGLFLVLFGFYGKLRYWRAIMFEKWCYACIQRKNENWR